MTAGARFRDDGRTIYDFTDLVLAVCPRCASAAPVVPEPTETVAAWSARHRLTCSSCGLVRHQEKRGGAFGGPIDPYFQLPLVLQTACAGHLLWAFNGDHLDHLEGFVAASVHERATPEDKHSPASLVEKLPGWIKADAHRADVLRGMATLRRLL